MYLRGLTSNFTSTHQTENSLGFLILGENKQLIIHVVPVAQDIKKRVKNSIIFLTICILVHARKKDLPRKAF